MLVFEIPGDPVPQKQTKFVRKTGIAYNPSKKDEISLKAKIKPNAPISPIECAIEMHLYFGVAIPQSTSKKDRAKMISGEMLPGKKPDFDNLGYLVTNSMKDLVYKDDAQVVDCIITKRYDETPRTIVKIISLPNGKKRNEKIVSSWGFLA